HNPPLSTLLPYPTLFRSSLLRYNMVSFTLSLASAKRNSPFKSAYHLMMLPGFLAMSSFLQASVRNLYTSKTDESRSFSEIRKLLSITLVGDIQRSFTVDGRIKWRTANVDRCTANTCRLSSRLSFVNTSSSSLAQK